MVNILYIIMKYDHYNVFIMKECSAIVFWVLELFEKNT